MTVIAGWARTIHLYWRNRNSRTGSGEQRNLIAVRLLCFRYLLLPVRMEVHMLARDEDILRAAADWRAKGRGVALATVVETWGSGPGAGGSNLGIDVEGDVLGSVSGGCGEGAVVTEALDVIESGKPKTLEFGVADETAWKVGLSCGGTIRVYVEKVD